MCRSLEGCSLSREVNVSDVIMIKPATVVQQMVVSSGSFGFSNWSQSERQRPIDEVNVFVECNKGKSVMGYTDGSVYDGSVGCGARAAVLVPIHGDEDKYQDSKTVGQKVTSVVCELESILLGLELSVNYFRFCKYTQQRESVYIFCDCTVLWRLISL